MRSPGRRRPRRRERMLPPPDVNLGELAKTVRYVGSVEHKAYPSFAGEPRPRADATLCDPKFTDPEPLKAALAEALGHGHIGGPWELDYPRYVWARLEGDWYEARLVNPVLGEYKGYRLAENEVGDLQSLGQ